MRRRHDQKLLPGGHDLAYRGHGDLLGDAVGRRMELGTCEAGVRLDDRLFGFVRLAFGVGELVFVVGYEFREGHGSLARQFLQGGIGLDQFPLVRRKRRLRFFQLLRGVVKIDLAADLASERFLAGPDELGQRLDQLVLVGYAHIEALTRRFFLQDLLVEALQGADELVEVCSQH